MRVDCCGEYTEYGTVLEIHKRVETTVFAQKSNRVDIADTR